jgi:hypothetical protein
MSLLGVATIQQGIIFINGIDMQIRNAIFLRYLKRYDNFPKEKS